VRILAATALLIMAPVHTACGYNEHVSLAMHVVASNAYLDCSALCPPEMTCQDIDCDLSVTELEAAGGYGYVAFVAYNVDNVIALEFFVAGWPLGEGSPDFSGPTYCPSEIRYILGEPFEKRGGVGGNIGFNCQQPCTGMFCLCGIRFGPSVESWLPITLQYPGSSYSYPTGPTDWVLDCGGWDEEITTHGHGCVIGGSCEPIPNCEPGPSAAENESWGGVKALYR
jgi:hypothetical protein